MMPKNPALEIFNNLGQPVLLIDRDYKIVYSNKVAGILKKQSSGEIAGQHCYLITHGHDRPCWQNENMLCSVKMAFEKRERPHAIHKHFHGDKIVVEVIVATPLDEGNGEFNYVIEEFQNITGLPGLSENVLSICATCKKIRDSEGDWLHIETYFHNQTGADFSHDICPACMRRLHPEIADEMEKTLGE